MRVLLFLTEPSPSFTVLFCATPGRPVDAAMASCLPGPEGVRTRLCLWDHTHPVPVGSPSAGGRARCDVGAVATPRWRRRAVSVAQRPREPGSWLSSARPVHVPPPTSSREADTRRRRRVPAEDSSRRRRRTLPRAGDGSLPTCGFSHRGPEAKWHCCGARETAQELQHGCGDDCSRSASLAALHARPQRCTES